MHRVVGYKTNIRKLCNPITFNGASGSLHMNPHIGKDSGHFNFSFMVGLTRDQVAHCLSCVMVRETLSKTVSVLCRSKITSLGLIVASRLRRSAHKHVRGPAMSRICF